MSKASRVKFWIFRSWYLILDRDQLLYMYIGNSKSNIWTIFKKRQSTDKEVEKNKIINILVWSHYFISSMRYNDLVSKYSLPLGWMLTDVFILIARPLIIADFFRFPDYDRTHGGCSVLHATWTYFKFLKRSVFALS